MQTKSSGFLFGVLFMSFVANCGGAADGNTPVDGGSPNADYAPSSLTGKTLTADHMKSSMVFTSETHLDMPELQDPSEAWTGPTYTYKKVSSTTASLTVEYSVAYSDSREVDSYTFETTLVFAGPSAGHMNGTYASTYDYGSGLSEKGHGTIDSDFVLR